MTDRPDLQPDDKRPEAQQGEDHGKIKQPQQTDATLADRDLARGSEPATHNRR